MSYLATGSWKNTSCYDINSFLLFILCISFCFYRLCFLSVNQVFFQESDPSLSFLILTMTVITPSVHSLSSVPVMSSSNLSPFPQVSVSCPFSPQNSTVQCTLDICLSPVLNLETFYIKLASPTLAIDFRCEDGKRERPHEACDVWCY